MSIYEVQQARKRACEDSNAEEYGRNAFLYSHLKPEDRTTDNQPFRYMRIHGEVFPIEEGVRLRDKESFIDLTPSPVPHKFLKPGESWEEKVSQVLDTDEE